MAVAVLGAGVVGLTTAFLLQRRGHQVVIYTRKEEKPIASEAACAIWLPFLSYPSEQGVEIVADERTKRWARRSWQRFQVLMGGDTGVNGVTLFEFVDPTTPDPYYADIVDGFRVRDDVEEIPASRRRLWQMRTFVIEMPKYLPWLRQEVAKLGARLEWRDLTTEGVQTLEQKVIFNCTGLGARELVGDSLLVPVKGQLLLFPPVPIDGSIGAGEFCIIPRSDSLAIGSLFLEGDDTTTENAGETGRLLAEASAWARSAFGQGVGLTDKLFSTADYRVVVGIRPCRRGGIRVAREDADGCTWYHNYGHGGSGVTLSWGSAEESVEHFEESVHRRLTSINPRRPMDVADVSIEVAHLDLSRLARPGDRGYLREQIEPSMRKAREIVRSLSEEQCRASIITLIDDKGVSRQQRQRVVPAIVGALRDCGVDYYCLESTLESCFDLVLPYLSARERKRIVRYRTRHEMMGCSDDIVVWYCLRLGVIDGWERVCVPCSTRNGSAMIPVIANKIISILPNIGPIREPERRAAMVLNEALGAEISAVCSPMFM